MFINTLITPLLTLLLVYKYEALFLINFIAAFVLPVPGSTALFAAGALASQGYFNITAVILTSFAANIAGDLAGFFLARRYGASLLSAIGFRRLLRSRRFHRAADYMNDFSASIIFFTRFLTEVGPIVNVLSGITEISARKFISFAILGEISYVLLYGMVGYALGTQWQSNLGFLVKAVVLIYTLGFLVIGIQAAFSRKRVA